MHNYNNYQNFSLSFFCILYYNHGVVFLQRYYQYNFKEDHFHDR